MVRCKPPGTGFAFLPSGLTRFCCALIFLVAVEASSAATWIWTGNGGNVNWSTLNNWDLGMVPASASTTELVFAGTNNTGTAVPLNQNLGAEFNLNKIKFELGSGSFFLGGGTLSFVGGTPAITQTSSNAQSIANTIIATTNSMTVLTLTGDGSGVVTLSGGINAGSGNRDYAVTKTGTSTFSLTAASDYDGLTTISAGVLNIRNATALGTTVLGTTVASGAALQIQGGIAVGTETLTLNGSGIAGTGALRNMSGNNSFAGAITLNTTSTIGSDYGILTLSGVISGNGGLTKTGAGTLTLSGAAPNTNTGATTVNQGTLILAKTGAVIDPAITIGGAGFSATVQLDAAYQLYGAATTINSGGQLNLNNFNEFIGTLSLGGGSLTTGTGLLYLGGTIATNASNVTATMTGNYVLLANRIFNTASGTTPSGQDLIISGPISEFALGLTLTKSGAGTLVLSGGNSYSGLTTISGGALNAQHASALGTTAAGTTVTSGAALQLQGGIIIGNEALSLHGDGIAGTGALRNISGNNSFGGAITLGSGSMISSDAGILTLTGGITNGFYTTTFGGSGAIGEHGVISGLGGVTKTGGGTLTLTGMNTYLGGTTINGGTIAVSSDANLGGATSGVTLNAGTLEVVTGFTTSAMRLFTLGNAASTFQVDAGQTFTVSTAITGTGTLNKTGSGTMVLSAVNLFTGGTNVISGTLRLGAIDRLLASGAITILGGTFDLQTFTQSAGVVTLSSGSISGTGTGRLTASSFILQSGTASAILGGSGTVTKNTAGTVTLSGANTFTGSTTINAGILQVTGNNALGTAASGTTVANGAVLRINNVNYSTAEALSINGTGIGNSGALANIGASTFAGPITAATNATINAGGGTLTLTGGLVKDGTTLTIAGGGTVYIANNGITGSSPNSDLVVDGTTVVLSAANSYNGPTTVQNSGTLQLGNSNVLPTSPQTALTVNSNSVFNLASHSDSVASLSGDSSALIRNSVIGTTSTLTLNPGSGVTTTFAGVIAGTNVATQGDIALQKNGAGTLILTGGNSYSGATTVSGGTLTAAANSGSALKSTSSITVNSGGTLMLGANNQINNTAPITLAGGTFSAGNFSEGTHDTPGLGALTLTASSLIDFGSGAGAVLTLAGFTPGSFTLTIANWTGTSGTIGDGSTDRLIFSSEQSANLGSFVFSGYGPGAMELDLGGGYYEITPVPVPEPSTYVAALLAFAAIGFQQRRRMLGLLRRV